MTQQPIVKKPPKTISVWVVILASLATIGLTTASGMFIGNQFFWVDAEKMQAQKEIDYYKKLVQENPDDGEHKVALAFRYYVLGDYSSAIPLLQAAIDLDDKNYNAYLNMGYVNFAMEKYDEALENFDKCTILGPSDYKGWLNAGITYYELEQYDKALHSLEKARYISRGSSEIHYHIGLVLEELGNVEEAIVAYEEALRYEPSYDDATTALKRLRG